MPPLHLATRAAVVLIGGAVAVVASIVASTTTENVTLIGAGSLTASTIALATLIWRTWAKENGRLSRALEHSEAGRLTEQYRASVLYEALQHHGHPIPDEYWFGPPQTKESTT